ncbi:hypothetical protein RBB75_08180 [Tunturibacter empetritectus]|uniref:Uncharacterized protein n=1 Tax=Tunturiibacter empetritectus TaxID=3069691 RepID=A0AAU7ZIX1_9BACT
MREDGTSPAKRIVLQVIYFVRIRAGMRWWWEWNLSGNGLLRSQVNSAMGRIKGIEAAAEVDG